MLREKEAPFDHAHHLKSGVQYTTPPPPRLLPSRWKRRQCMLGSTKTFQKVEPPSTFTFMQGLSYIASIYILKN